MNPERNFIEGAARVMYVQAWVDRQEQTCKRCSYNGDDGSTHAEWTEGVGVNPHDFEGWSFAGQELMDAAPPTPDYVRHEATKLLGRLEQANPQLGGNLPSIMAAAQRADHAMDESIVHNPDPGKCNHRLTPDEQRNFGHCIAMQALGRGVSWFDDHADFELNVPHVEFELED